MTSQSKKGESWARKQGDVKRQVKRGKCKMQGTDTAQREREQEERTSRSRCLLAEASGKDSSLADKEALQGRWNSID